MLPRSPEELRQFSFLMTPPGQFGSGSLRYGAAMSFNRMGLLSNAALELYRIASAKDAMDPGPLLADAGLSGALPDPAELLSVMAAPDIIVALIEEADRYLSGFPNPGVAEVRAGIARWNAGKPIMHSSSNSILDDHLPTALAQLSANCPALAATIAAAPYLNWITYDLYDPALICEQFARNHVYTSLIGENAAIAAQGFDLGLFLIAPDILYRDHHHAAPELYAPLTGPHGWRFGPGSPLTFLPAHRPVWNPSHQAHMTKVGPTPFLCIFAWTGDVQSPAHVIAANDWPELEALRLGP